MADLKVILRHRTTWGTTGADWTGWLTSWDGVFDPNGTLLTRICSYLEWLAQRYDASPAVIGYNVENFPFHWKTPTQLEIDQYHTYGIPAMANAVRKHSSKTLFISPIHKGQDYPNPDTHKWFDTLPRPTDQNVIIMLDGYGLIEPDTTTPLPYTKEQLRAIYDGARQYKARYNVPLMIDEFGLPTTVTEAYQQYLKDLMDVHAEFTDSWMWEIGYGSGGGFNLMNSDHTVLCPKTVALLRERAALRPTSASILGPVIIGAACLVGGAWLLSKRKRRR
jgi:hypothetical protein